jgi:hypothetical protein
MMRFARSSRTAANPALVTALAIAIVAITAAGGNAAGARPHSESVGPWTADRATRLMAAAVAAARDLLVTDQVDDVALAAPVAARIEPSAMPTRVRFDALEFVRTACLNVELIDLPPPAIC